LCEAGDIASKYGRMMPDAGTLIFTGSINDDPNPPLAVNYLNADSVSTVWTSIVFHCPIVNKTAGFKDPTILCAKMKPISSAFYADTVANGASYAVKKHYKANSIGDHLLQNRFAVV
jgi:hypothetical protein